MYVGTSQQFNLFFLFLCLGTGQLLNVVIYSIAQQQTARARHRALRVPMQHLREKKKKNYGGTLGLSEQG